MYFFCRGVVRFFGIFWVKVGLRYYGKKFSLGDNLYFVNLFRFRIY